MLAERSKPTNVWAQIGAEEPSKAAQQVMRQNDDTGYKARVQMLDDISGEFDPITDADSNYGRVIGIKVASRTNPAIAEDMDVSPERKAPVQMLYDLDGPQPTDPSYASLRMSAVRHKARGPSKQQKLRQMIEQGIIGTADKAPVQMLAERSKPNNVWAQIGAEEPSKAAQQVMRQNDDTGYKARVQMLDDISGEFDPITDADSNYGRVIGIKVASRTNPAIAEDMDVSPERKARVQVQSRGEGRDVRMLACEVRGAAEGRIFFCVCSAISKHLPHASALKRCALLCVRRCSMTSRASSTRSPTPTPTTAA